jgi:serine/threonine protein kinase/tetratricopeptide (TPR) repeat protein
MGSGLIDQLNRAFGGRYLIERELGSGGMGLVFLAQDLKHHRPVAIKVLRPGLSGSLGASRFLSEIQVAARLQHPNIVALYDSGEAEGVLFFVMSYVEGESLRDRLRREGPLPIEEAIRVARDVADALGYAHAHHVVHRDVKPENIWLAGGRALVMDFGIARAVSEAGGADLTETGIVVGTPQYMAPEQTTHGPQVDGRADVYALGCVVYEMLAGEPPYTGTSAQSVIAKVLADPVPSVRRLRDTVPLALEQALVKALAKIPADRFASTAAFGEALTRPSAVRPNLRFVAVLPFLNLSADPENEYFADGITEDVIAQLSKIRVLRVISRSSVMPFKKREQSLQEIAAKLGVATLVDGSVRRAGNRIRVVAHLIDAGTDQPLWTETYDRELTDIFAIQGDVALRIAGALDVQLTRDEKKRIGKEPTSDIEAYHLYLKGRHCRLRFTAEGLRQSLDYFEEAIDKDPRFALAHAGLAWTCVILGMGIGAGEIKPVEAYRRGRRAVRRALELDDELGEAHGALALLTFVNDFGWADAEREFKRALELNAGDDIWDAYGLMLSALGRYDDALAAQRRAKELDPLVAVHASDIASTLLRAGRYEEAVEEASRLIKLAPEYPMGHSTLGWARIRQGRADEGLAELERAVALAPANTMLTAQLGQACALLGQTTRAREILQQLEDLSRHRYVSPYHLAYVSTGLGEHEKAIDRLEEAYEERAGGIYGVAGSFLFTALHPHPRFRALLEKMNLQATLPPRGQPAT